MSYVVIDSGGTKADWAFCTDRGDVVYQTETKSFGLGYVDFTSLPDKVRLHLEEVESVFYYGSGINSESARKSVEELFTGACNKSCSIYVNSDLLGAARSTAQRESGYIAILGTGSNFCYYNGSEILQTKPALGYIIGDEGAGSSIGKAIIKAYLYNEIPEPERRLFESKFELTKDILLTNIAQGSKAPRYIAQYASIAAGANSAYLDQLVLQELQVFFERKILSSYENMASTVHFIGSIAYFYSYLIKKLCATYHLELGQIIQKPITGLIKYHNE